MSLHRLTPDVPTSSMADIAFLLLTFFLVTTTLTEHKGLPLLLPEWQHERPIVTQHDRDIYSIMINRDNALLVEGERRESMDGLRDDIKHFLLHHPHPAKAVVSIKTDRGATYEAFIQVLDEAEAAYVEIYAQRCQLSPEAFRRLDLTRANDKRVYDRARAGWPKNISLAQ